MTNYSKTMRESLAEVRLAKHLTEAKSNVDAIRDIVKNHQNAKIKFKDGQLRVDAFTASAVVQVLDKVNPANKKKIENIINKGSRSAFSQLAGVIMKMDYDPSETMGSQELEEKTQPRQLKDPKKEMMIKSDDSGVFVIDKKDFKKYQKKGFYQVEETELDEKFTRKDFDENEDKNYHTENAVELVNMFGDNYEKRQVAQIKKDHDKRGHITSKDQKVRDALVKKYLPKLKEELELDEASVNMDSLPFKTLMDVVQDMIKKLPRSSKKDYEQEVSKILKSMGVKEDVDLTEGRMKELSMYIDQKKKPDWIAKKMGIDVKAVKALMGESMGGVNKMLSPLIVMKHKDNKNLGVSVYPNAKDIKKHEKKGMRIAYGLVPTSGGSKEVKDPKEIMKLIKGNDKVNIGMRLGEGYKPVKDGHYDVKITVKKEKDVEDVVDYINDNMGQMREIDDIDIDGVSGGGMSNYSAGDIYLQGDDAGEYGVEIAKKFRNKIKVMGEEIILEGTWKVPETRIDQMALRKALRKPIKAKDAEKVMSNHIGDDSLYDMFIELEQDDPNQDVRPLIKSRMKELGIKENYRDELLPFDSPSAADLEEAVAGGAGALATTAAAGLGAKKLLKRYGTKKGREDAKIAKQKKKIDKQDDAVKRKDTMKDQEGRLKAGSAKEYEKQKAQDQADIDNKQHDIDTAAQKKKEADAKAKTDAEKQTKDKETKAAQKKKDAQKDKETKAAQKKKDAQDYEDKGGISGDETKSYDDRIADAEKRAKETKPGTEKHDQAQAVVSGLRDKKTSSDEAAQKRKDAKKVNKDGQKKNTYNPDEVKKEEFEIVEGLSIMVKDPKTKKKMQLASDQRVSWNGKNYETEGVTKKQVLVMRDNRDEVVMLKQQIESGLKDGSFKILDLGKVWQPEQVTLESLRLGEAILKDRDYEYDEKEGVVKISKKNFAKVRKDSKGTDKSKPTMMVLTKKGTSLVPVKFTEEVELDEAKYELYHKDFSTAMQHAYKMAKKLHGITIKPEEIDQKVATGPSKPGTGKTNSYRLKGDRGAIQVQVYNKGGSKPFELNMYKEELEESAASDARRAMLKDKDLGRRGADPADVDDKHNPFEKGSSPGQNIVNQLRKVVNLRGIGQYKPTPSEIKKGLSNPKTLGSRWVMFDKGMEQVDLKVAAAVTLKFDKIRRPADKLTFQRKISRSYKDMLKGLQEEVTTETILDRIDRKLMERKNA